MSKCSCSGSLLLFTYVAWVSALHCPARASVVEIAAAANLKDVLTQEIIPQFEKQTGDTVSVSFGPTKLLSQQLENGKSEDVFLSADAKTVDKLSKENVLVGKSAFIYAIGQLVLWTRSDSGHKLNSLQDIRDLSYSNIAIGNPNLVPYGKASIDAIHSAGLDSAVAGRIVRAGTIEQALIYAKTGNADAAFTALSLVIHDKKDSYIVIPKKLYSPLRQKGALVAAGDHMEGKKFLDFLASPVSQSILKTYGYLIPQTK